ncbi:MAG TPA: GyrI-like domain-containing protein [Thermoleophilaceae bacterium]
MRAIEIRDLAAQPTAVRHEVTPPDQLAKVVDRTFPALFASLRQLGVTPAGPPFVRYLSTDDPFEVELGVPVPAEAGALDGAEHGSLPGGRVAVWSHYGPYSQLRAACEQLGESVRDLGEEASGPFWESYVTNPATEPDASKRLTEIYLPLR